MNRKIEYWNEIGARWKKRRSNALWRIYTDAIHIDLFLKWFNPATVGRVLKTDLFDEAISDGLYPFLASRARHVFGIDLSDVTSQAAKEKYATLKVTRTDVRNLPFASSSLDCIISDSTLDHFDSPGDIGVSLGEFYRVLRPGGRLILTIDNPANPAIALRNRLPFTLLHRMGILPFYVGSTCNSSELRDTLRGFGFKVVKMTTIMHCFHFFVVQFSNLLDQSASEKIKEYVLRFFLSFEWLAYLPTRFFTGHFLAVVADKNE